MKAVDIIVKKRNNGVLTPEEISFFIEGSVNGDIPDYQTSALLMAIYFRGLNEDETFALTKAMIDSGERIDLSAIKGIKVDKHSTGGVGDKTTLIVGPIVASLGVPVAKMSGRGLGHTGGTIDKLESIPGFNASLSSEELIECVQQVGMVVATHTANITPADKKLYALRDVTGTVDNVSLVASSIMSKKIASGNDAIVLDVKCGSGAFFEDEKQAKEAVRIMLDIGKAAKKEMIAVISNMDRPLGNAIGNSLEVVEAIEILKGKGASDLRELSVVLSAVMLVAGQKAKSFDEAKLIAEKAIADGGALSKFKEFVASQGGNSSIVDDYSLLGEAKYKESIVADREGFIKSMDAKLIGLASQRSGAGRSMEDEEIDYLAGIVLSKKTGDAIIKGEIIATIYSDDKKKVIDAKEMFSKAYSISGGKPKEQKTVKEIIWGNKK